MWIKYTHSLNNRPIIINLDHAGFLDIVDNPQDGTVQVNAQMIGATHTLAVCESLKHALRVQKTIWGSLKRNTPSLDLTEEWPV